MLYVLSGNVRTGKTRWLQRLLAQLSAHDIVAYGVIAPGVWIDHRHDDAPCPAADANGFEKTGIDNILLPDAQRIPFARRADLAVREGSFDKGSQSAAAGLGWHISEEALAKVNAHFAHVAANGTAAHAPETRGLLVVDELGRLELERGGGLVEAVRALELGPTPRYQDALAVVRTELVPLLEDRFGKWGGKAACPKSERDLVRDLTLSRP